MSLLIASGFVSVRWCTQTRSTPTLPRVPRVLWLLLLDILGPSVVSPCTPNGRTRVTYAT